jgi:dCTP deaminase
VYLSTAEIKASVEAGDIRLEPYLPVAERPASYVVHLDEMFRSWLPRESPIRMWSPDVGDEQLSAATASSDLTLEPGAFVLGQTREALGLSPRFAAVISPLSHIARFGLAVNLGAHWISPGFGRETPTRLALEIVNLNNVPLIISAGMPICHLRFATVSGEEEPSPSEWNSIYEGRSGLSAPLLWEDFANERST